MAEVSNYNIRKKEHLSEITYNLMQLSSMNSGFIPTNDETRQTFQNFIVKKIRMKFDDMWDMMCSSGRSINETDEILKQFYELVNSIVFELNINDPPDKFIKDLIFCITYFVSTYYTVDSSAQLAKYTKKICLRILRDNKQLEKNRFLKATIGSMERIKSILTSKVTTAQYDVSFLKASNRVFAISTAESLVCI